MTISDELAVWGLTGLTGLSGGALHLLIRINNGVRDIKGEHKLAQLETKLKIETIDRHQKRNDQDTAQMRRHLNLPHLHHGEHT